MPSFRGCGTGVSLASWRRLICISTGHYRHKGSALCSLSNVFFKLHIYRKLVIIWFISISWAQVSQALVFEMLTAAAGRAAHLQLAQQQLGAHSTMVPISLWPAVPRWLGICSVPQILSLWHMHTANSPGKKTLNPALLLESCSNPIS